MKGRDCRQKTSLVRIEDCSLDTGQWHPDYRYETIDSVFPNYVQVSPRLHTQGSKKAPMQTKPKVGKLRSSGSKAADDLLEFLSHLLQLLRSLPYLIA